jgi:MoaA/NifB/PqqE/SkfB family radical SAM enzyme
MKPGSLNIGDRARAIQARRDIEQSRVAHAVEHMRFNKAYQYAVEAAGADPEGQVLASFVERFRNYREAWRGQPRAAIEQKLHHDFVRRTGAPPLSLDIEVAAVCDLACPFCYRQSIATPDKIMPEELCYRLLDECGRLKVPSVKFNWRGEPLLHPKLPEFIDYAKRQGVLETLINTDAVTLTAEKSEALIDAGLDMIIYSFDGGTKETYESMRPGRFKENHFEDVYGNIRRFAEIRERKGARFPRTKIQMVLTDATHQEQDRFFALFEDCVDDVSVKAYTERGGELPELDEQSRADVQAFLQERGLDPGSPCWRDMHGTLYVSVGRLACEQIFQRLMITYDGRVSMCCYDWGSEYPVGYADELAFKHGDAEYQGVIDKARSAARGFELLNRVEMPRRYIDPPHEVRELIQIWDGKELNDVRERHVSGRLDTVPVCRGCRFKETHEWMRVPRTT